MVDAEAVPETMAKTQTTVELDHTLAEDMNDDPELSDDDTTVPKRQKLMDASTGHGAGETRVEQQTGM
jgi:hypothetical protein